MKLRFGIFLIALTTLLIELLVIRIFDVILTKNLGYMVITAALFALGLGGVYRAIWPIQPGANVHSLLARYSMIFGVATVAILPLFNLLPFDFDQLTVKPLTQAFFFSCMYLCLVVPFFFAGLVFTTIFSEYSKDIQILYFWDLVGAGVGSVILIPFLPQIGPGGTLFIAGALALIAAALFSDSRSWRWVALGGAVALALIPLLRFPEILDFEEHASKRGVKKARIADRIEFTRWDPISKIDLMPWLRRGIVESKQINYDGGSQSSTIFPFDGDYVKLRAQIESGEFAARRDYPFWRWGVLASHYIKRDQDQKVLVIGSAAGQETKAALTFGASLVDAIELVGTVVQLGLNDYADYNGGVFTHPNVNAVTGEGRSFLRGSGKKYDIIQIFSNHTSSSIAQGTGAMATTYLQTAEAYEEYFSHLADDGVLHVNHHIYPKMVTTAALAWSRLGYSDFQKHVVVFLRTRQETDTLPTMLIKMTPWTPSEIQELKNLIALFGSSEFNEMVEDPIDSSNSFLTPIFYSGAMPSDLIDVIPYRVAASTDDRPYFNFLRKSADYLEPDSKTFVNAATAGVINSQLRSGVPLDVMHLFVTGALGALFFLLFVFGPMFFSRVGRAKWPGKYFTLAYFACLGGGFIILELIFIQIFMNLIGYPLYTASTVILTMLVASGTGSLFSFRFGITPSRRWSIPFWGVLASGFLLFAIYPAVFDFGLQFEVLGRIGIAILMIFPIGFFLGMPFPLGILMIRQLPTGAVAWAWSMNGLFTVVGGIGSVVLSIFFGFDVTLLAALAIYVVAFGLFAILRGDLLQRETATQAELTTKWSTTSGSQ